MSSGKMVSYVYVEHQDLQRFALEAFLSVHVARPIAEMAARALWLTSVRGVDSHGIRLLPHYIAAIQHGRINPNPTFDFRQTTPATGTLDADHALGHAAGIQAMQHAIHLAEDSGAGFVSVRNSTHCGALATYGLEAANRDMIGLVFTAASPTVRTSGGIRPFFGTNPLCVTAPMQGEAPFCFDAAPTPFTGNKLYQYREDGKRLPRGVAADERGHETRDVQAAFQLLPIGDYKGFGLLMVVDLLSNLLAGMPSGNAVSRMFGNDLAQKRYLGHFFAAVRIDAFTDLERFKRELAQNAEKLRSEPRRDAAIPVQVPGDPEKAAQAEREQSGIPVKMLDMENLRRLARELHIAPPVQIDN